MSYNASLSDDPSYAQAEIGIVVALPEELATLTSLKLKQGSSCKIGNTWLAFSGAGLNNAKGAAELLVRNGVRHLVSWGCAAGLSAELVSGDLVIATQVIGNLKHYLADQHCNTLLQQHLAEQATIRLGALYSSATLVGSSHDKQRIHYDTQAIALDMESAAVAEVALTAGLSFSVIRSIADPANLDLPIAVSYALNENGKVEMPKLLFYLLLHPWELKSLLRLGLHFQAARNTLKKIARILLTEAGFRLDLTNRH